MSRLDPPVVNRRSFLSLASLGTFFAAIGTAVAGILRLPNPAVLPGPVRRFKLGPPEQFTVGTETAFAGQESCSFPRRRRVLCDHEHLHALGVHGRPNEGRFCLSVSRLAIRQPGSGCRRPRTSAAPMA